MDNNFAVIKRLLSEQRVKFSKDGGIELFIPADEDGMSVFYCDICDKSFKTDVIMQEGTVEFKTPSGKLFCPYCGAEGGAKKFLEKELNRLANEIVKQGLHIQFLDSISESYVNAFIHTEFISKGKEMPNAEEVTAIKEVTFKWIMDKLLAEGINTASQIEDKEAKIQDLLNQASDTKIICDYCGTTFSIYGRFASCPVCQKSSPLFVFNASIRSCQNLLWKGESLFNEDLSRGDLLKYRNKMFVDALKDLVGTFDELGQQLRYQYHLLPAKPLNLFQNLEALAEVINNNCHTTFDVLLSADEYSHLKKMFQVRHVYEHNGGVVDQKAIDKCSQLKMYEGRIYPLEKDDVLNLASILLKLAPKIEELLRIHEPQH